ncbi:hypothetical protein [Bradyrhizobium sp. ERR14]|uniref:hypothetical protein n=1 Tax=Bradyrhizobium sp. ERR14 TaxID=2663837 RepID=UPI0016215CCE|nr:hypothetical protein [Bradyrhizobium sp. ERR14]MBB4398834.1 hypothetical protein [Bradyrhizobium sp. ERR14]
MIVLHALHGNGGDGSWFLRARSESANLLPQQLAQCRRRLGAADVVDLARQAERARSQFFEFPGLRMLVFELNETLVQIVQSRLELPDAGVSIHFPNALCTHRRSLSCLTAL